MPNEAPAALPLEASGPAPKRREANAPVSVVAEALAPSVASTEVRAPAPRLEVAVAPASTVTDIAAPAPVVLDRVVVTASYADMQAPAPGFAKPVAPAARVKELVDRSLPPPPWRKLLGVENLMQLIAAIQEAKEKIGEQRARLTWSRASQGPAIPITSFHDLTNAVLGEKNAADFDAETLLNNAIAQLPQVDVGSADSQKSNLELEGLWIQFAGAQNSQLPRLDIAVSIDLSDPEPELGPFSMQRVYLKFGDSIEP